MKRIYSVSHMKRIYFESNSLSLEKKKKSIAGKKYYSDSHMEKKTEKRFYSLSYMNKYHRLYVNKRFNQFHTRKKNSEYNNCFN